MRFFINLKGQDKATTISKKELETKVGFRYVDETVTADDFKLPPYNLTPSLNIIPRSKLSAKYQNLSNPANYLHIFHDGKTGWSIKARKRIPKNCVVIMYAGIVINVDHSDIADDYELAVSLPYKSYFQMLKEGIMKYIGFVTAKQFGNLSRLFSHLPQRSKLPPRLADLRDIATENVKPISVFDAKTQTPMIFMVSTKQIEPNEPVGFDYGREHFRHTDIRVTYFTKQCQSFYYNRFFSKSIYASPEQPYGPYRDAYCFPGDEIIERGRQTLSALVST